MDLKKQVTYLNIKELTPYKRNPRKNDKAVDKLSDAIGKNSFRGAIIVWENSEEIIGEKNIILAGNTRYKALKKMGEKEVPVILERFENEEEAFNFCIVDNKSNEWAEWDFGKLEEELKSLNFLEEDLKDLEEEFKMDFTEPKPEEELNSVPEVKKEAYSQVGDLFLIDNRHRVLCGDSTKKEDVERLMSGDIAIACITDPPYCVDYEKQEREPGRKTREQKGDTYKDPVSSEDLLNGFIENIPSDILVMTFPVNKHFHELSDATREWEMLYECVWVKNHFAYVMGRRYQPKHEPILIFRRKNGKSIFNVPPNQSTVFEYDKPSSNKEHPTMKPIGLYVNLVEFHSNPLDLIYEPFGGSGTTLIACEETKRNCNLIEKSPQYIDVILKRYHKLYPDKEIKCLNREFNFEVLYG